MASRIVIEDTLYGSTIHTLPFLCHSSAFFTVFLQICPIWIHNPHPPFSMPQQCIFHSFLTNLPNVHKHAFKKASNMYGNNKPRHCYVLENRSFTFCIKTVIRWKIQTRMLHLNNGLKGSGFVKKWIQRWNSWAAFFVEVSRHKRKSSQTRLFSAFLPSIFCLQNSIQEWLKFSCFADFLEWFWTPEKITVFFKIRQ